MTPADEEALIRDADLKAELEAARGNKSFAFPFMLRHIIDKQQRRDEEAKAKAEKAASLAALPREKRRRTVTREALETAEPQKDDLRHIHSVLAVCGLPYSRLPAEAKTYERRQGNMSLLVKAGEVMTPHGEWVSQPIPYGPKARLILMHLCSEALHNNSATIELADTFTAFVREMGFSKSGGERGPLTAFKHQLNALAGCELRLGTWNGQTARTKSFRPINDFEVWLSDNPGQRSLWPSTVTFSPEMFDSIKQHSIPINIKAVRAFSGSARKLDLYFWLGWRLHNIESTLSLGWEALGSQFGVGFTRERAFKAQFAEELSHIKEVFPKLPLRLTENGLILEPASPDVLSLPTPKSVKRR
jgi:hypothetical protein